MSDTDTETAAERIAEIIRDIDGYLERVSVAFQEAGIRPAEAGPACAHIAGTCAALYDIDLALIMAVVKKSYLDAKKGAR